MLFDGTPTRWFAIVWHYLLPVFEFAGGVWAIFELPSVILRRYRQIRNKLALRSQSSAGKRLKKLESELVELDQMPVMEQHQVRFYVLVFAAFSTATIGLAAWAFSIFIVYKDHPSVWVGLALTMLLLSSVVSLIGMNHFQPLMEAVRRMRRQELETGITAMKNKLAKFGETQRGEGEPNGRHG